MICVNSLRVAKWSAEQKLQHQNVVVFRAPWIEWSIRVSGINLKSNCNIEFFQIDLGVRRCNSMQELHEFISFAVAL